MDPQYLRFLDPNPCYSQNFISSNPIRNIPSSSLLIPPSTLLPSTFILHSHLSPLSSNPPPPSPSPHFLRSFSMSHLCVCLALPRMRILRNHYITILVQSCTTRTIFLSKFYLYIFIHLFIYLVNYLQATPKK